MSERSSPATTVPEVSAIALADSLLAGVGFGVAVLDSELRFVQVNARMAQLDGLAAAAHAGRSIADVWPGPSAALATACRAALATGQTVREARVVMDGAGEGAADSYPCSCHPITDRDTVVGVWVAVGEQAPPTPAAAPGSTPDRAGSAGSRRTLEAELESEHRIVTQLQVSLMADRLPRVPGADMASAFRPAGGGHEIGGDFFDVFPMGPECWMLVIGDVCGKGAEAAALTALARYTLRAAAIQEGAEPAKLLAQLNEAVLRQRDDSRFLTAICAFLEAGERGDGGLKLTLSVAGHPLPLRVRASGSVERVGGRGALIGVWEDPDLGEEVVHLEPGESLVLYTDGVTEAGAPNAELGENGLSALLSAGAGQGAQTTVAAIEQAVLARASAAPRDDVAVLVVRPAPERDR